MDSVPFEILCTIIEFLENIIDVFRIRIVSKVFKNVCDFVIQTTHNIEIPKHIRKYKINFCPFMDVKPELTMAFLLSSPINIYLDDKRLNKNDIVYWHCTEFSTMVPPQWEPNVKEHNYLRVYYLSELSQFHYVMKYNYHTGYIIPNQFECDKIKNTLTILKKKTHLYKIASDSFLLCKRKE
jgi:hypothetical protein